MALACLILFKEVKLLPMETIELRLSHSLYNAGILGLIKILDFAGKEETYQHVRGDNKIIIKKEALDDFEKDYYKFFEAKYGHQMVIQKIINDYENLDFDNPDGEKNVKEWAEYITKKLKSASYKSAYKIIEDFRDDKFSVLDALKDFIRESDSEGKKEKASQIMVYLKKHKDVFMYKNIIYNIINNYWSGISFFGTANVKKEMDGELKKAFVDTAAIALENHYEEGAYECDECYNRFRKKTIDGIKVIDGISTWLKDYGADYKKKSSHYWNFKLNQEICGMCKLVYSCIPAGFFNFYRKGFFVNVSSSIEDLIAFNQPNTNTFEAKNFEDYEDMSYGQIVSKVIEGTDEMRIESALNNIQIVKRVGSSNDDMKYHIENLGKRELHIISRSFNLIKSLRTMYIYDTEAKSYIYPYSNVMENLANGKNLYPEILKIVRLSTRKGARARNVIDGVCNMIKIQVVQSSYIRNNGGDNEMLEKNLKKIDVMYNKGLEARMFLNGKEDEINNKLRGLIYQLTNALQASNISMFMDRLIRLYSSYNKPVPRLILDMIKDENDFLNYGYAYVMGLRGKENFSRNGEEE